MNRFSLLRIAFTVLAVLSLSTCSSPHDETSPVDNEEVMTCFNLTNAFRTGNEAWFWNKDNKSKTDLSGKLKKLSLDKKLCQAAKVRANEIVKTFSHNRPNGSSCFTVLKDFSITYSGAGENIAAGNQRGSKTFNQWKEDSEKYAGQGHRRNMLGDFTKIGIACAYDKNSQYKYYWVMILTK